MLTLDSEKLEEKIDSLIEEMNRAQQQRRRDRVFSKIDGLFYMFITLSTFICGIIMTQYRFLIETWMSVPLIGVVLSLLTSFIIGLKAMISDSMENRIYAWCLLFGCPIWFTGFSIVLVVEAIFGQGSVLGNFLFIVPLTVGIISGILQMSIVMKSVKWMEAKFTSLLGVQVSVWSKIKMGTYTTTFIVFTLSLFLAMISHTLLS